MASTITTLDSAQEIDASDTTTAAAAAAAVVTERLPSPVALGPPRSLLSSPQPTEGVVMRTPTAAWSHPCVRPWHRLSIARVQPTTDYQSTSNRSLHRYHTVSKIKAYLTN